MTGPTASASRPGAQRPHPVRGFAGEHADPQREHADPQRRVAVADNRYPLDTHPELERAPVNTSGACESNGANPPRRPPPRPSRPTSLREAGPSRPGASRASTRGARRHRAVVGHTHGRRRSPQRSKGQRRIGASQLRPHVSLIVPAHNEQHRLLETLRGYAAALEDQWGDDVEILVIVNGSTDDTASVAKAVHQVLLCQSPGSYDRGRVDH